MEWEEVSFANYCDDPLQFCSPESFFDPRLESLETFPKNLLSDTDVGCSLSDFSKPSNHLGKDNEDFRDFIGSAFDDAILNNRTAVLSSDEIFSQIEICSDFLDECNQNFEIVCEIAQKSSLGDIKLEDYTREVPSSLDNQAAAAYSKDYILREIDLNLEKVEFDIAKLKQEVVDISSDDDSMWSDFFSEDDSTEISKEYDELLQSLLTTPVDDIDLALNVFNNVDQAEDEASGSGDGESSDDGSSDRCSAEYVLLDHCYTLPWEESSSVLLTPPNSSDDSDQETEPSSPNSRQYTKISVKSDTTKFIRKTVKLKHKKDLKFVFSIKVKENLETAKGSPAGRSLLKKNHLQNGLSPTKDLVRDVLHKRSYTKRQKLTEAAMAVQSLLNHEHRDVYQADKLMKMQTEREIHNSMERQRRIELKNEFDNLKCLIPEIAGSEKVSKLNVLNYSAQFVRRLEKTDVKMRLRKTQLREKQQKLLEELHMLRTMY